MSNVDPGAEARGGGSFQRENLADLDDVATTGAKDLAQLTFDGSSSKWVPGANVGGGSAPAVAAGANNGTTPPAPTVTAGGTDARGIISFGSGGTPAAGAQVTVTFAHALPAGTTPFVHLQETNSATKALNVFPTGASNTGFTVSTGSAPTASQASGTYLVEYDVES